MALPDLAYSILKSLRAAFFAATAVASRFLPLALVSGTITAAPPEPVKFIVGYVDTLRG